MAYHQQSSKVIQIVSITMIYSTFVRVHKSSWLGELVHAAT